jgi:peptidoglycan/xylan/chitin deacetylase (PgdA/CDA1 family)
MGRALVIVYHDIARGRSPLRLAPELLQAHLDAIAESGATPLSLSELVRARQEDRLPPRPVCLTFDDGFASVVEAAAPLLLERGYPATVCCVAGYLGRTNDWPSQPGWVDRRPLVGAAQLAELVAAGFEIAAHGFDHVALGQAPPGVLRREVVDAREALRQASGRQVETFAYPYGSLPDEDGRSLVGRTYRGAGTSDPRLVRPDDDRAALPRVDAHYLRRPELLRRLLEGSGGAYLRLRRAGRRVRGLVAAT